MQHTAELTNESSHRSDVNNPNNQTSDENKIRDRVDDSITKVRVKRLIQWCSFHNSVSALNTAGVSTYLIRFVIVDPYIISGQLTFLFT